jgi:hypothetical protein
MSSLLNDLSFGRILLFIEPKNIIPIDDRNRVIFEYFIVDE